MTNNWITILLPFILIASRVAAFMSVLPLFSWSFIPTRIRVAIAMILTIFIAYALPDTTLPESSYNWINAFLLIVKEVIAGVGLGLAARMVYVAIQQGIEMGTQQMGFSDAGVIDPSTGDSIKPIGTLYQMIFAVLFLAVAGHQIFIVLIFRSYEIFPLGQPPEVQSLVVGLVDAGGLMLLCALKIAAPLLGGFLILAIILGVLARVMPEMNILMISMPLRVTLGVFLSIMILPTLNVALAEVTDFIEHKLLLV